ncbi:Glycosyl transferase group 1 [Microcystis aeruginosa PCC 9806]|nr:glycosyltransferase [Microcystis aeruginosa]CCI12835.1 Glycosyl transferase group 1 [Microcystis aeruginosa PCC 9806]
MNNPLNKKIAIYYPCFLGGGAEAVGLWMMEALKDKYHLTLITFTDIDWQRLNLMYGTTLNAQSIKVDSLLPKSFYRFNNALASNNKHFRQLAIHLSLRYCKQKQRDYDLVISAYNAADLGKPGMQYIHCIKVLEGGKLAQKYYNRISNFSVDNLKKNFSLANSGAVAAAIKDYYGIDATVVYPPVVIEPANIAWQDKENAFICSGRLVEAKQPHRVIQCLEKVRQKGIDLKLYITGGGGGNAEAKYKRYLDQLIRDNSDWVQLLENLSYEEYSQVLYRCKYGIHFKPEPFGISIAEMVKAGIIPFTREGGGPAEIIGQQNTDLFFNNIEDAVEKIAHVMQNEDKQYQLLSSLEKQKVLFSTDKFMEDINNVVTGYLQGNL